MRVPLSWLRDFAPFPAAAGDRSSVVDLGRVMDELGLVVEGVEWVGEGLSDVVVSRVLEITAIPGADRIRRVVVDAGAPAGVSGGASAGPVEVVCGAWNFSVGDLVPLAPVGAVLPGGFAIGRRKMRGVTSNGMLCSAKELGLGGDAAGILVLGRSADAAGGSGAASGAGGSGTAGGAGAAGGSGAVGGGGPEPGTPLAQALGISVDAVYDLAIETNRPDALCVAGVARDVAARLGLPFAVPGLGPAEVTWADLPDPGAPGGEGIVVGTGREELAELASVSVEAPELCPRFLARALVDVTVGSSPPWLAGRLTLAGMRPINSIVDASNYVMLELGQPTHPYDLDRLAGHGLTVRQAGAGEQLVTLDGVERVLGRDPRSGRPVDDCLICDAEGGPVGIAGIMGGSSSEISEGTTRVLLEAAYFDPMAVARTSRRLGLRTEASMRFERGCDPEGIDWAVERFCRLVSGGGAGGGGAGGAGAGGPAPSGGCPRPAAGSARVVPGTIEVRDQVPALAVVKVRTARVNAVLGTELSDDQIAGYLGPIGFMVTPAGPGLAEVTVPSWRPDSTREIDVVEEIARHHGYSSIARTRPVPPGVGGLTPYQHDRRRVRASLVALGASEAWTPSLLAPDDHAKVGLGRLTGSRREPAPAGVPAPMDDSAASSPVASDGVPDPSLEVENPLAREESVLRRTLLPGLLRALAANASHRVAEVRLFEVGHVFARPPQGRPLADERELVAVALARAGDDARSAVSAWRWLAETLRLAPVELVAADPPGLHPTRSARLVVPGAGPGQIGVVGEVDPAVLETFDLGGRRVGWLELDLGALLAAPRRPEELAPVGRFPSADIDLAFVVDDAVPAAAVEETLSRAGGERLVGLELFDVYRGGQWGAGRRSLAYRLRLASLDHTLTDEELASLRATCVAAVEQAHPARLRG